MNCDHGQLFRRRSTFDTGTGSPGDGATPMPRFRYGQTLALMLLMWVLVPQISRGTPSAEETLRELDRYTLVRMTLNYLHHDQYDSVFALSRLLQQLRPDDPIGYFLEANAYHTRMRDYRVAMHIQEFDSLLNITLQKAEAALRKSPDAENYFIYGAASGYRSLHLFWLGKWIPAIKSALRGVSMMRRAVELDSSFVDPLLGLGLYEYAKSKVLLGLLGGDVDEAIRKLRRVAREGAYLSVNARYSLVYVYFQEEEYDRAWEIHEGLFREFPQNPACLYDRALLLEKLGRPEEALTVWQELIARIEAHEPPGHGFLAECYYHVARYYQEHGEEELARENLIKAARHAWHYSPKTEVEGPYFSFKKIKSDINHALHEWDLAVSR
ncbi:MAG: hypothetical protein D6681_17635 [Calditrichaeota bacterium]|nr:MAG: hypothetical protein D6681_17635 [Calditrichota bacterium]